MSSNFDIKTLITDCDRQELKDLFDSLSSKVLRQGCHLFNIERRDIDNEKNNAIHKISSYAKSKGYNLYQNYFLKYEENSFTRVHADDPDRDLVKMTVVTVIENDNLIGGDCLVFDRYENTPDNRGNYITLSGVDSTVPYGKNIIPVFVKINPGQSVIYDGGVEHGVTRVCQVHRIVLVSWFN